ncbi:MAG: OmpA family protein [Tannerellaceae bacterium]|jgi:hypothetical protein|nr:OmpA family protein [Tannerellaceae bacterium]
MRHHILIIILDLLAAFAVTGAAAGITPLQSSYSNLKAAYNRRTGRIELTFDARLKPPGLNYSLTVAPQLSKDGREGPANRMAALPAYVMEGEWFRTSRLRKERSGEYRSSAIPSVMTPASAGFTYKASVSQNDWEEGVNVIVYTTLRNYHGIVAQSVFRFPLKLALALDDDYMAPSDEVPVTRRPFVERISTANRDIVAGMASIEEVEAYIETNGEGSLTIHFEVGSSRINPNFMGNARTLHELLFAIAEMKRGNNAPQVVVVGYASPEGNADVNRRLATERAANVRNYISSNSELRLPADVATYDGGINWAGLKRLALSDYNLPRRNDVFRILEMPVWDSSTRTGRLGSLMRLAGGEPYRYMTEVYFPQLRGAAFIKVFYK